MHNFRRHFQMEIYSLTNSPSAVRSISSQKDSRTPMNQEQKMLQDDELSHKKDTQQDQRTKKEKVEEAIKVINEFIQPSQTAIKFEMHEKLDEYYVKVIDERTKEVIREIPSKKLLDLYAAMKDFIGLIVDKKI